MKNNGFKIVTLALGTACALSLTGCGHNIKQQLGLIHPAPDEFAVVRQAPLAMPPDFALRPPEPGATRPQAQSTTLQAQDTVFGDNAGITVDKGGSGADEILQQAGANHIAPHIRQTVDSETDALRGKEKTAMQKLGLSKPSAAPATVVNAKKEAERLKQNEKEGKPVTAGETPSVTK